MQPGIWGEARHVRSLDFASISPLLLTPQPSGLLQTIVIAHAAQGEGGRPKTKFLLRHLAPGRNSLAGLPAMAATASAMARSEAAAVRPQVPSVVAVVIGAC